ncbi:MAG: RNA polymerase sigma-70 factor [Cyclobacteriaceae bacterium]
MKDKEISYRVEKLRAGDEVSFRELYDFFSAKIYNVCRKMHLEHEDAEGVVQDVFLKVWRNKECLVSSLSFNAYLLTIVRSMVIKMTRKKAYHVAYETYAIATNSIVTNHTEDYIIFSNLEEISSKALDELPVKQKQIFMMKNVEHYSVDEISESLNLSKRTVENQIYRATKSLKEKLENMKVISVSVLSIISNIEIIRIIFH